MQLDDVKHLLSHQDEHTTIIPGVMQCNGAFRVIYPDDTTGKSSMACNTFTICEIHIYIPYIDTFANLQMPCKAFAFVYVFY